MNLTWGYDYLDMNYDLHSHSWYSDGELSPVELVELAVQQQVDVLALTDHDSVSGIDEAQQAANDKKIKLIHGIEFSVTWNEQLLHVVGLNIDTNNQFLNQGIKLNQQRRHLRAEKMFEKLEKHDIHLREQMKDIVYSKAVPTRPHFAQALIQQGKVQDFRRAFKQYLARGKIAYVPMQWATLEECVSWITNAGGIAVLAHPIRYDFTTTKLKKLLADLKQVGAQAMEVVSGNANPQQITTMARLANEFELHASIGSDFHSPKTSWAMLGKSKPLPKEVRPVWELF